MCLDACVFSWWCTACTYGCILKSVYLWVVMHCRICVHKQGSMDAHRYVCTCVHAVCVLCFIVVTVLRECVPGSALWAPCTKNLSVLPGGIWLSVWAAPQSAGPCAQPPALSTHTHSHTHSAHLTITHALHQPCLNRIMTHSWARTHTCTTPTP